LFFLSAVIFTTFQETEDAQTLFDYDIQKETEDEKETGEAAKFADLSLPPIDIQSP
jgi:hypothetical protein